MNLLRSLAREEEKLRESTRRLLSPDGTDRPSYFFNYGGIQQPSICGEPGKLYHDSLPLITPNQPQVCIRRDVQGKAYSFRQH